MPVLNERSYLADAVRSVLQQEYAGEKELILALAPSNDGTDELAAELAAADDRVILVANPKAHIPDGLNAAIAAAHYDVIIRVDAHSELSADYTTRGVESLNREGAANVGGVMHAEGKTRLQAAIARAYNSRFGLGGGTYHRDGLAGEAESAYLGIFKRQPLIEVGMFDPTIRRGEDWELNLRLREAGHKVWFEPALRVTYWPRTTLLKLAQQMSATGTWRAKLVRRYRGKNPWRFFVPGALVLATIASVVLAILQLTGAVNGLWSVALSVLYLAPLSYLVMNVVVSFRQSAAKSFIDRVLNVIVFATMHFGWGWGFLVGITAGARNTVDKSRA